VGLKAVCPSNPEHKKFITVAHVSEDWCVNERGDFIESRGILETVARPNVDNTWTCDICGAEATVTRED
jgi:hypothetical protein